MQPVLFDLNFRCELSHWWFVARRRIIKDLVLRVLAKEGAGGILDVGCGTGGNIGSFGADYRCAGVDLSPHAIELARSRFPQVGFVCGEACETLRALAGATRMVLLTDVLEHTADDRGMLARLVSIARPGTHFLLTVPADRSLWSIHDQSHGHYRRYDREQFERLWKGLPVATRMVSYFNARLYPLVKLVRTIGRFRHRASGEAGTDLAVPAAPINRALERVFSGERRVLIELLDGVRRQGYPFGVSLIAVLRRESQSAFAPAEHPRRGLSTIPALVPQARVAA